MRLEGKVAIVTGGGRGIGRAECLSLAGEGAAVIVNDFGEAAIDDQSVPRDRGGFLAGEVAHGRGDLGRFHKSPGRNAIEHALEFTGFFVHFQPRLSQHRGGCNGVDANAVFGPLDRQHTCHLDHAALRDAVDRPGGEAG